MNAALDLLNAIQASLHGLARGNLAAAQGGGQLGNGQLVQHGMGVHSTIFGTMKSPLALAGALRNASALGRDGRTSSGRNTLTIGTAWAVGSMRLTSS